MAEPGLGWVPVSHVEGWGGSAFTLDGPVSVHSSRDWLALATWGAWKGMSPSEELREGLRPAPSPSTPSPGHLLPAPLETIVSQAGGPAWRPEWALHLFSNSLCAGDTIFCHFPAVPPQKERTGHWGEGSCFADQGLRALKMSGLSKGPEVSQLPGAGPPWLQKSDCFYSPVEFLRSLKYALHKTLYFN